jgi:large subunit ribosomal protein L35
MDGACTSAVFRRDGEGNRKMPKLKTKRSAVKRFRMTGSGKIKAGKANRRHNLSLGKNRKRKNRLGGTLILERRDERHLKKSLPYGLPK